MRWYILRRGGVSVVTLFIATVVVFLGVRALPGDPTVALTAETSNPEVEATLRAEYGLDKPVPLQYVAWMGHALQGDLGTSPKTGLPVSQTIAERLPITLELTVLALLIALLVGVPIGILAAVRRGSFADYVAGTTALAGLSIPHFWLGILFILAFAVNLEWLPASGFVPLTDPLGNLAHMVMPATVLGITLAAVVMRQMRSAMLESLGADYVRTARAKGLAESVVLFRHVLKNAMIPILTGVVVVIPLLFMGSLLSESFFGIPGLGSYTIEAIQSQDFAVVRSMVFIGSVLYIAGLLLTDLSYTLVDPRIKLE